MRIRHLHKLLLLALFTGSLCAASAQSGEQRESVAEELHRNYRFGEAIDAYRDILKDSTDYIATGTKLVNSLNGKAMLEYAIEPRCLEKQKCSINGFFLKFPGFAEKSWCRMPATMMSVQTPFSYIQIPADAKRLIFSAPDEQGSWNLYSTTRLKDTLWSAPELLNSSVVSSGNEVFPYLSPDGTSLLKRTLWNGWL